jgi:WD40 repeat protein
MSNLDRLERDLAGWFAETAMPQTPVYLDDILQQTARVRQRPRWTFIERLIPVETTTSFRGATGRLPWRTLGALALLILALLVGAIFVGSTQRRLPVPFGPAGAGLVAYSADGDILVVDPVTNAPQTIVGGPETDLNPQWSRDGTRILFERRLGGRSQLLVVASDGSGLTTITPDPLMIGRDDEGAGYAFSPDGKSVLFMSGGTIQVARSDGSGVRAIETPDLRITDVSWRPVDGSEIAAVGEHGGVYLLTVADGAVRTLVPPSPDAASGGISWSPDGSKLTYYPWSVSAAVFTVRARIFDVVTGEDRVADPGGDAAFWDAEAVWSNDGQRLAIIRGYADGYADVTVVIVRVDGTGPVVETAHGLMLNGECCASFEWAPDDSAILWTPVDEFGSPSAQRLIDPNTGEVRSAPWGAISDPAWQRVAP